MTPGWTLAMGRPGIIGLIRGKRYRLGNIGLEGMALLAVCGSIVFWPGP